MNAELFTEKKPVLNNDNRSRLLTGLPVTEKMIDITGLSTAVLEGGAGPPVILLHGPGENSFWWMRVIPQLVNTHRVIAPDLPGHGESGLPSDSKIKDFMMRWLNELIDFTCSSPPILVGHVLGGAIAARYAVDRSNKLASLILVDSLGLGKFRPTLGFGFRLIRFMIHPTKKNYNRFLPHCMYDVDRLRKQMGKNWDPFLAYIIECASNPDRKATLQTMMQHLGVPRIPSEDLTRIDVQTTLIWGRHDHAIKLKIAKTASESFGWPLFIIDEARDDPKLEQPKAFVQAFNAAVSDTKAGLHR